MLFSMMGRKYKKICSYYRRWGKRSIRLEKGAEGCGSLASRHDRAVVLLIS